MVEIYRRALRYYWSAFPILLGLSALMVILMRHLLPVSPTVIMAVWVTLTFYHFHRHFLFGDTAAGMFRLGDGAAPRKIWGFSGLFLAIFGIPVLLAIFITASIAPVNAPVAGYIELMLWIIAAAFVVGLALFGTALPASVERPGNFRMAAGMGLAFETMWRLLLGPVATQVLIAALLFALDYVLEIIPAFTTFTGQTVFITIVMALNLLAEVMAAAVLCHMYQKVMGAQNTSAADVF